VNGALSLDDIRVLPLLRSAAVVKGLRFPPKVRDYFETMMERIGYAPLPVI
jgi:glutaredoxin 2